MPSLTPILGTYIVSSQANTQRARLGTVDSYSSDEERDTRRRAGELDSAGLDRASTIGLAYLPSPGTIRIGLLLYDEAATDPYLGKIRLSSIPPWLREGGNGRREKRA